MKQLLETKTKVRFQDCDPFNHLNNAKYLDYFMNAREDQLLEYYSIDIFKMAKTELKSWVVTSNQIAYLKPAFTMEEIVIESQLIHYTDKSLKVEMRMYNETKTELKSLYWVNFVHFDLKTQRPTVHSEELMQLFETVITNVKTHNFDERMISIR
ncbi:acyl-CoA thioesterase [Flavobacterium sp.]|uniref:acyl-CoA thioesterase n=1 Tax=Flavobacterium sp. TaxID=239 RepID=UPI002B4AE409|nr:acyl-CoA thioesterase [Flavobacterium sp.]HLP63062.1 acyl-CoA thioesterase [Flavobacterium sp.]